MKKAGLIHPPVFFFALAVAVVALFLGLTVYFTASGDHFDQAKTIYQVQP